MSRKREKYFKAGLLCSFAGHALLMLVLSGMLGTGPDFKGPLVVYSVSIESGKSVGGIRQAPSSKKSQKAPPKKVAAPKKESQPKKVVETKKEKVPDKKAPSDAEVSVAKKKKEPEKKKVPKETKKAPPPKKVVPAKKKIVKKKVVPKKKEPTLDDINKQLQQAVQRYTGESTDAGGTGFGSRGGGGSGMGGGVVRPPEFFTYMQLLESRIKSGWRWHNTTANLETRVCFSISEKGVISGVQLCGASGNREYDDSVQRAVHKANPVPAPPTIVYEYFKSVRMTFQPSD